MKIIFLSHPVFLGSNSMPRYANWLSNGMIARGHEVEMWQPQPKFFDLPAPASLKKWLGYIDQYIVFRRSIKKRIKRQQTNVLYVFTDHALGPWVPYFKKLNHVIHCHDFLAQHSAIGHIAQNKTGFGGRIYQKYIRAGYTQGRNFISISKKTQEDLSYFLGSKKPKFSEVVYNGLNQNYVPQDVAVCRDNVGKEIGKNVAGGYLLHVGGNQWYKNRVGVIKIYSEYREVQGNLNIPLVLVGPEPNQLLLAARENSPYKDDIHFLCNVPDEFVKKAYCGATVFLFPSLAEGFGWPIAEAMASGSAVVTTNEAPMTEVAGNAAVLIAVCPIEEDKQDAWAKRAASEIAGLINNAELKANLIQKGLENARRFDSEKTLDTIESLYKQILGSN